MSGYPRHWEFDDVYDSLEKGCGDFLLDLKGAIDRLRPGSTLMVASRDAGAPLEIPAWCRLTGHRLQAASPPFYLIVKKNA